MHLWRVLPVWVCYTYTFSFFGHSDPINTLSHRFFLIQVWSACFKSVGLGTLKWLQPGGSALIAKCWCLAVPIRGVSMYAYICVLNHFEIHLHYICLANIWKVVNAVNISDVRQICQQHSPLSIYLPIQYVWHYFISIECLLLKQL